MTVAEKSLTINRKTNRTLKKKARVKTAYVRPTARATARKAVKSARSTRRASLSVKDGCILTVSVVERQGQLVDRADATVVSTAKGIETRRASGIVKDTAYRLAAVGHPKRLAILALLLEGPAVYRAVQKKTSLRPGPLYHHVNQLRLAGLIRPKERDLYELTRGGRNVVLIATALSKLAKDGRSRPALRD